MFGFDKSSFRKRFCRVLISRAGGLDSTSKLIIKNVVSWMKLNTFSLYISFDYLVRRSLVDVLSILVSILFTFATLAVRGSTYSQHHLWKLKLNLFLGDLKTLMSRRTFSESDNNTATTTTTTDTRHLWRKKCMKMMLNKRNSIFSNF